MLRLRLRACLDAAKPHFPTFAFGVGAAIGAFAVMRWGAGVGLDWWSFLLGFVVAVVTLYLLLRDRTDGSAAGRDEWHRVTCERQRVETECSRWIARRARLECRRLQRELREPNWKGGEP